MTYVHASPVSRIWIFEKAESQELTAQQGIQKTIKHNRFPANLFSEKLTAMAYNNIAAGIEDHAVSTNVRHIHLSYNPADLHTSALRLILTLFPDWEHAEGNVEFVRFTDGITNTVCMPPCCQKLAWRYQ